MGNHPFSALDYASNLIGFFELALSWHDQQDCPPHPQTASTVKSEQHFHISPQNI